MIVFVAAAPVSGLLAQQKYWFFIEKEISKDSSKALLSRHGLQPIQWSRWFHAWSAEGAVCKPGGVDSVRFVAPLMLEAAFPPDKLGFALEQIRAEAFLEKGLTGKGVKVGIIDGGFLGADRSAALQNLLAGSRIKAFKNFMQPSDQQPFSGSPAMDDGHGTDVLELVGGKNMQKNIQFGLASAADYYLARTDHGAREERREEDFLIAALEWMDSLGVRLVNVSLGYNTNFDNPSENYSKEMMDGKTTLVSLACQKASNNGMLVVVAAGNDGGASWQILSAPADAPGVLTVGATDLKFWKKMPYSSTGPEFVDYVKPEISCFASSGTSFSAPIITGLAACLWERSPTLSNQQIKTLILRSGHLAAAPNNYLGYGVPDCGWLLSVVDPEAALPAPAKAVKKKRSAHVVLSPHETSEVVLFHKKDRLHVTEQEFFSASAPSLTVKAKAGAAFTTVIVNREFLMEIEWVR